MEAWKQLLVQLAGATAVAAFALIVMGFAFFVIKVTMGLRVDKKVEIEGLDHEEHGLSSAYGDFVLTIIVILLTMMQLRAKIVKMRRTLNLHLCIWQSRLRGQQACCRRLRL